MNDHAFFAININTLSCHHIIYSIQLLLPHCMPGREDTQENLQDRLESHDSMQDLHVCSTIIIIATCSYDVIAHDKNEMHYDQNHYYKK